MLQWRASVVYQRTDSAWKHSCISNITSRKTRVRNKAASEMLIMESASEYGLVIDITLVKFHENWADKLTRVSKWWLDEIQKKTEAIELECVATLNGPKSARVLNIHHVSRYPSLKHGMYFTRILNPGIPKVAVREGVKNWDNCQSIDSASVH